MSYPIIVESLRQFLERVLAANVLAADLVNISERGATDAEIALAPPLPIELRELLAWHNGLDLDVVRLHGVGNADRRVSWWDPSTVAFASDPAGFTYLVRQDGAIVSVDHDGGEGEIVAENVDDFLRGYVFGPRAAEFAGDDWHRELRSALGSG